MKFLNFLISSSGDVFTLFNPVTISHGTVGLLLKANFMKDAYITKKKKKIQITKHRLVYYYNCGACCHIGNLAMNKLLK